MIIITGSGRSGTSILSKILFEYGLKFESSVNSNSWKWCNQNCGFERQDLARLNREICKRNSHIGLVSKRRLSTASNELKKKMLYFEKQMSETANEIAARIGGLITTLEIYKISYTNVCYPNDFIGDSPLKKLSKDLNLDHKKIKKICNELFDIKTNYKTTSGEWRR